MKKGSGLDIDAVLSARKAPAPRTDADSFARDFKARATLMRQDPVESGSIRWDRWGGWNWRYVAAAVTVCLIVGGVVWPARSAVVTQIKSLQIYAPHSGVIIMTDEHEQGTVVWVTDMESNDGNRG
jgi:hypothetical protein